MASSKSECSTANKFPIPLPVTPFFYNTQTYPNLPTITPTTSSVSLGPLTQTVQHALLVIKSFPVLRNWSPTCSVWCGGIWRWDWRSWTPINLLPMSTQASREELKALGLDRSVVWIRYCWSWACKEEISYEDDTHTKKESRPHCSPYYTHSTAAA